MFTTPEDVAYIIARYTQNAGAGGFAIGTVTAAAPLEITLEDRLVLRSEHVYVSRELLRLCEDEPLETGDALLLLQRPEAAAGRMYVLLCRLAAVS